MADGDGDIAHTYYYEANLFQSEGGRFIDSMDNILFARQECYQAMAMN